MHLIFDKLFKPTLVLYFIILAYLFHYYFTQSDNWSDKSYYNWMNFKRIGITAGVIVGAIWFRMAGNHKVSNIILYSPVAIAIGIFVLGMLMMFLLYYRPK
ncbi:MAG: hypothetical protein IPN29_14850 [Saprospiraceae bacterium]|nr:hypothetical protein [Saprospiraceae bacterium]